MASELDFNWPVTQLKDNKRKVKARREAKAEKPKTFERILVAAVLALSPKHQRKSPFQLLQVATSLWDADRKVRDADPEKRNLVATVAKMRDEENRFGARTNARVKGTPTLPHELWMERMENFGGDKHELLLELLRVEVPRKRLLKELFSGSDVSREEEMKNLLLYAGRLGARDFVGWVASLLVQSQPQAERDALLSAIATLDVRKADKWLAETCFSREHLKGLLTNLGWIKVGRTEDRLVFHKLHNPVPGLICRWLIRARQQQTSFKRAKAAKTKPRRQVPEKDYVRRIEESITERPSASSNDSRR